ncbi:MAG: Formamidopyrimidine-DNA glycosylase [Parcubacteria bacterium C7867-006]|nr:MAG: Formamidopyrimidine-DNA glycosylase [Parcubacteria bacterium C7867-006]
MPELPEVTTTVNGLNEVMPKLTIKDVWSDYYIKTANKRTDNIKNKKYFGKFRNELMGEKFKSAERRGKNVLIHFTNNKTVLIHMKMTGHLLYGKYEWDGKKWKSDAPLLSDPFNKFIHLIFNLSNGKSLAFSDMRKFAKVLMFETDKKNSHIDLVGLGPEPLDNLSKETLKKQILTKPNWDIKTVLMDQSVIAGIGNIYSDEILWTANIHPERKPGSLMDKEIKDIWKATGEILEHSIKMGGDSMSDYRNIYGEKGNFQNAHKVYRRVKQKCLKRGCDGVIQRKIIGGRSAHFCNTHQK